MPGHLSKLIAESQLSEQPYFVNDDAWEAAEIALLPGITRKELGITRLKAQRAAAFLENPNYIFFGGETPDVYKPARKHVLPSSFGLEEEIAAELRQSLSPKGGNRTFGLLQVKKHPLEAKGGIELAEAIQNLPTPIFKRLNKLEHLLISDQSIGDKGIEALAPVIGKQMKGLKTLKLDKNAIGPDGALALAKVIPDLSKLTELDLSGNNIQNSGALAGRFPSKLRSLNLAQNNISDLFKDKGEWVGENEYRADMHDNGKKTCQLFQDELKKELEAQENEEVEDEKSALGEAGAKNEKEKFEVPPFPPILRDLTLSSNQIKNDGACGLVRMIRKHKEPTGIKLDLRENAIGYLGAGALTMPDAQEKMKFLMLQDNNKILKLPCVQSEFESAWKKIHTKEPKFKIGLSLKSPGDPKLSCGHVFIPFEGSDLKADSAGADSKPDEENSKD